MYIERTIVSGRNGSKDFDDSDNEKDSDGNYTVWVISKNVNVVTPYTYDEAISLAGHGPYTIGLVAVCCLSLLGLCMDLFGFSVVVISSSCDLEIGPWEHRILTSMPFLGAIMAAYVWGYVSDTKGRRYSLIIAMWGGFIATTVSAFSPNWIVLASLKLISVSFSSCAQSATYTLIGECCPMNVKKTYFFILNSFTYLSLPIYTALGYATVNMNFSWNLGFLNFTPWRLLILCMGIPLGISAICLHFFYESPKFLANVGEKGFALESLRHIWRRNRCVGKKYPVEKLVLEEEGHATSGNTPLLVSLWRQTAPLFKKPLLLRILQLYFLNIVVNSVTTSLVILFPFLTNAFISGISSNEVPEGLCKIIQYSQKYTDTNDSFSCITKSHITVVWASAVQGLALVIINFTIKAADRKFLVTVMMLMIAAASAGCAVIENNPVSLFLFLTIFLGRVVDGIVSSYYVDLFPTSYRGMAACLAVMVSSTSGLLGSSVYGLFIISQCSNIFYIMAAGAFCGAVAACFLPSDKAKGSVPQKSSKKRNSM